MTTIAYKDGIIACDSRLTADGTLISDSYNKMISKDGYHFFIFGSLAGIENLLDIFFENKKPEKIRESVNALVFDSENKKIFCIGVSREDNPEKNYLWRIPVDLAIPDAWGSGQDHALTAFDYGANAVEAIEAACKRDIGSGGEIKAFDINTGKVRTEAGLPKEQEKTICDAISKQYAYDFSKLKKVDEYSIQSELYKIIDDISTAGDMFKPDIEEFERFIFKKVQEANKYIVSDGHHLYYTTK